MNKPLRGHDVFGAIWVHLQEPEADFIVFHILALKTLMPLAIRKMFPWLGYKP